VLLTAVLSKAAVVTRLFVNANILTRDEVILDMECNDFGSFSRIYLDLLNNFETVSEYEICETGFNDFITD
jgi:hypothetical protein